MELSLGTRWGWGMGLVGTLVLGCCWLAYTQRVWGKYDEVEGSGSDSGDSDSEDEDSMHVGQGGASSRAGGTAVHVDLANVQVGCRVRRGVDWRKGNQDGGEHNRGTVVAFKRADGSTEGGSDNTSLLLKIPPASAVVLWDAVGGQKARRLFYAIGHRGEHHLQMARAAPQRPRFFWREPTGRGGGSALRAAPSVIPATRPLTTHEAHRWRAFGTDNAWGADSELRERKGAKGDGVGAKGGKGSRARDDPFVKPQRREHSAATGAQHLHHDRKASKFQGANPYQQKIQGQLVSTAMPSRRKFSANTPAPPPPGAPPPKSGFGGSAAKDGAKLPRAAGQIVEAPRPGGKMTI